MRRALAVSVGLAPWLAMAVAVAFISVSARAQEAGSEASSESGASAGAQANIINTSPADVNLYNTPNVGGPALTAGLTDCTGSTSGGVGWAGMGLSFGRTNKREDCERRNDAAVARALGREDVAENLMCQSERYRIAMLASGTPCLADRAHVDIQLRGASE